MKSTLILLLVLLSVPIVVMETGMWETVRLTIQLLYTIGDYINEWVAKGQSYGSIHIETVGTNFREGAYWNLDTFYNICWAMTLFGPIFANQYALTMANDPSGSGFHNVRTMACREIFAGQVDFQQAQPIADAGRVYDQSAMDYAMRMTGFMGPNSADQHNIALPQMDIPSTMTEFCDLVVSIVHKKHMDLRELRGLFACSYLRLKGNNHIASLKQDAFQAAYQKPQQ